GPRPGVDRQALLRALRRARDLAHAAATGVRRVRVLLRARHARPRRARSTDRRHRGCSGTFGADLVNATPVRATPLHSSRRAAGGGRVSTILPRQLRSPLRTAVGGEGAYLIDSEGRRYLDASGGAAVSCLGHNHPAVSGAVRAQLEELE